MQSHPLLREPGLPPAGIGRRLSRRAGAIAAPIWQARHRHTQPWANPQADLLNPGRVPEESYRDYVFRRSIWL